MLAQLQGSDVKDNGPAVFDWDLCAVAGHGAHSVGYSGEILSHWICDDLWFVQRERQNPFWLSALDRPDGCNARVASFAQKAVAGGAKNTKAVLPAKHHGHAHRRGKSLGRPAVDQSAIQMLVFFQIVLSDGARHRFAHCPAVLEQSAGGLRFVFFLEGHVLDGMDAGQGLGFGPIFGDKQGRQHCQHAQDGQGPVKGGGDFIAVGGFVTLFDSPWPRAN